MNIIPPNVQPRKRDLAYYAQGAVNAVHASLLPITPESNRRLAICKACPFYSENSKSPTTGSKSCNLCGCPVEEKVKIPKMTCELPSPHTKW